MGIIAWIVLGLIAGLLAKFIMPGNDPGGIIITICLGIGGALVGGFLATQLGIGGHFGLRSAKHGNRDRWSTGSFVRVSPPKTERPGVADTQTAALH